MVIRTSSFGIISSILTSDEENSIFDLLSSPYFSLTSFKSSTKRVYLKFSSERISLNLSILLIISSCSVLILSISRPVSFCSLRSKIALAWISDNEKFEIKPFLASSGVLEDLISLIIASRLSRAINKPSKI